MTIQELKRRRARVRQLQRNCILAGCFAFAVISILTAVRLTRKDDGSSDLRRQEASPAASIAENVIEEAENTTSLGMVALVTPDPDEIERAVSAAQAADSESDDADPADDSASADGTSQSAADTSGSDTDSSDLTTSERSDNTPAEEDDEGSEKLICLTFDDGPGIYTNRLLDILEANGAKATFFMIGELVGDFPSAVQRERELGMEQGNHTWDHETLTHLSDSDILREIGSTNDKLSEVTGASPTLFRPPGGGYNDTVLANCYDLPVILWSIDTEDWMTKDADITYNVVMSEARDGSIILCHEIYESTIDAAERFIPDLISQGYRFVTVSEMAAMKGISLYGGQVYGSF